MENIPENRGTSMSVKIWRFPEIGGTPSHLLFQIGIFHEINHRVWGSATYGNPIYQDLRSLMFIHHIYPRKIVDTGTPHHIKDLPLGKAANVDNPW